MCVCWCVLVCVFVCLPVWCLCVCVSECVCASTCVCVCVRTRVCVWIRYHDILRQLVHLRCHYKYVVPLDPASPALHLHTYAENTTAAIHNKKEKRVIRFPSSSAAVCYKYSLMAVGVRYAIMTVQIASPSSVKRMCVTNTISHSVQFEKRISHRARRIVFLRQLSL